MLCLVGQTNVPVYYHNGIWSKAADKRLSVSRQTQQNASQESALLQAAQVATRECTRKEHICGSDATQNVCTISPISRINLYTKAV